MFEGPYVGTGTLWNWCPQPVCGDPDVHALVYRRGVGKESKITRSRINKTGISHQGAFYIRVLGEEVVVLG